MKKIFLLLSVLFLNFAIAQSPMTVTKIDGTPITDGQIITFDSTVINVATLGFYVHNNSNADIDVRIKCLSLTGTGTGMQLCFGGLCYNNVIAGNSYPAFPVTIAAGQTNTQFDHFYNSNQDTGGATMKDYTFKFYQVNANGTEVGNSVTFTYRYNPTLSVNNVTAFNQLENMGVNLKSNVLGNTLSIEASKNNLLTIYDLNGKLIKTETLNLGANTVDVSNLNKGMYILNFKNEDGKSASLKAIK